MDVERERKKRQRDLSREKGINMEILQRQKWQEEYTQTE